jgi:anti-sigma-K factor RskA
VEHVDELIPAHAMRSLDPDDERAVAAHLADCDRCRRMLADFEGVSASLAYAAPRATPPPELRERLLASLEPVVEAAPPVAAEPRKPRFSWWPRVAAVAVPALAVCVLGLVVWNVSLRDDLHSTKASLASNRAVYLNNVGNVVADSGGNLTLYADLAPAPAGKTYEAWVIGSSGPIPAGTFKGGGTVVLDLTAQARPGDQVAITVEPAGGSEQPTTKPFSSASV